LSSALDPAGLTTVDVPAERLIDVVRRLLTCGNVIVTVALVLGLNVEDAIEPGHTCGVGSTVGELKLKRILLVPLALNEVPPLLALNLNVNVHTSSGYLSPRVVPLIASLSVAAYPALVTVDELTLLI
jgi:hypothetical protein